MPRQFPIFEARRCKGVPVAQAGETVVYAKPLEDGALAVGLFNRGEEPATIGFTPRSLGMWGEKTLRDVWRQQDIGVYEEQERFEATVNPHGVLLLRISPCNSREKATQGR